LNSPDKCCWPPHGKPRNDVYESATLIAAVVFGDVKACSFVALDVDRTEQFGVGVHLAFDDTDEG